MNSCFLHELLRVIFSWVFDHSIFRAWIPGQHWVWLPGCVMQFLAKEIEAWRSHLSSLNRERPPAVTLSQFKPHIPVGGGLKCCEALLLSAHCSWTLFSSGKSTPSFHTWDVKEISHLDSAQGCGVRQIYLKQSKGLNASHLLRLVNLGWLGLGLQSWFSCFSSRAEKHSWWSQNKTYSWKRFKQMVFFWHLCGPHWLLKLGWHRKTWAVSLMVGWVGLNENIIFI